MMITLQYMQRDKIMSDDKINVMLQVYDLKSIDTIQYFVKLPRKD